MLPQATIPRFACLRCAESARSSASTRRRMDQICLPESISVCICVRKICRLTIYSYRPRQPPAFWNRLSRTNQFSMRSPDLQTRNRDSEQARQATTRTVFISYSHDSPEHSERIRALAGKLEGDGLAVAIDQFANNPVIVSRHHELRRDVELSMSFLSPVAPLAQRMTSRTVRPTSQMNILY
jgi:hypothetical protein